MLAHTDNERASQIAADVLERLKNTDECPSCHATILIEALVNLTIENKLDPHTVMSRYAAGFVQRARAELPACDCDDCQAEVN